MKKLLSLTAFLGLAGAGALCAVDLPAFNVDAKVCFDTENVNRGRKEGQQNFKISTEAGVALLTGHGYIGASSVLLLEDPNIFGSLNSVSPYVGFCHDVGGWFTVDGSLAYHRYTNVPSIFKDIASSGDGDDVIVSDGGVELSVGFIGEMVFSPKLYFSYDFDRREFNTILSASYVYDLGALGLDRFALKGGLSLGYDTASRPYGCKAYFDGSDGDNDDKKGYFYYGLAADLVYKYNEQATFHAGVRFSGNAAKTSSWANSYFSFGFDDYANPRNLLWFSSAVEFSF
ncbi:MAG: hypothetical protein LBB38_04395 [Puniceicoccales bacterium]|jgi:hypothetical protein|nr:hypothetical protein [Puniceicoccales bacterium]